MATRLLIAVMSNVGSPRTSNPLGASVVTAISAFSAATLDRLNASDTTKSTSTTSRSGSFSAPCSRDSAMSSVTMLPRRRDSASTCSPKWRTVSGSSEDSSSASASTPIAPTGVLSS
ncbi:Uncharacterised protein [Mycobacteroides abscessus subsp. abscessus]|nr:Uncharacterised protein [Mycobacteroides abscessus subsp. abscessus]